MPTDQLTERIVDLLDDKQAQNILTLNVSEKTSTTEVLVIADGRSDRQIKTLTDHVIDSLKDEGERPLGTDGTNTHEWVVIDYGSVMVHLFLPELRQHYALEELWRRTPSQTE